MSPRARITPFLRGRWYWARVPRLDALAVQRSLGTDDLGVARAMCEFLRWLRGRRESYLLDQLASGKVGVGPAYTAYTENRLEAFIRELREGITDADLEPYVARWQKELERRKRPNPRTRGAYLAKVRTLMPEDQPFRRSQFTKQKIREWLSGLDIGQPNRYRAALSSFAEYLVFEDALPSNPVRQVPMATEREPRALHLSPEDATRLVGAIERPYRGLHALMLCTGMEVGAALAVLRQDLDFARRTAYARGTKRAWRQRTCTVYGPWLALWATIQAELPATLPTARVFAGLDAEGSLRALRRALAATGLPEDYRQHDHRHTWAVRAVRDGLALHTIAYQLGHRDATMVMKVYGRYQPQRSDFDRNTTPSATPTTEAAI